MAERERLNRITETIIGAAIQVHRTLGPGLLESAYVACLAYELGKHGLSVEQQRPVPLVYEEVKLECGYRADLVVEKSVIVESEIGRESCSDPRNAGSFLPPALRLQARVAD